MGRILKVFASGGDQLAVIDGRKVIELYDGFALIETTQKDKRELSRTYLLEDITDQYTIKIGEEILKGCNERGPDPDEHHYLVQFIGPIKPQWLKGIEANGGDLRVPYQNFTYVVKADEAALKKMNSLPYIKWVCHLPHWARIATSLRQRINTDRSKPALPRTLTLPDTYQVEFFGTAELEKSIETIEGLGIEIIAREDEGRLLVVKLAEDDEECRKQIEAMAAIHGVRSIRERIIKRTANDVATRIMAKSLLEQKADFAGEGEIIGICDTGLDTGDPATVHEDFANRVKWIKSYPITPDFTQYILNPGGDDGPSDKDSGHGTHVSGSVLGDGSASVKLSADNLPVRGLAHKAQLVFQAVEQELRWKDPKYTAQYGKYLLAGLPLDISVLFSDAYEQGARIHSNSWGGGDPGAYDTLCEQLDRFIWEHKDFCVLFAAGNDGTDKDGDGKINLMSVTSPGTAKNCITVGACESHRDQFDSNTYGMFWPKDYPVDPPKGDVIADNPSEIACFSSRGPTLDGRIKPDVVAPGTYILSTRSTQINPDNTGWAANPASLAYFYMGGTSMATPLTAGAVALLREYLRKNMGIPDPSAALLKAALIIGAERLPVSDKKAVLHDFDQGFGRVNLDGLMCQGIASKIAYFDVKEGLETGSIHNISLNVLSARQPLKVVLAYSDYPGRSLVNNLNLVLKAPDGKFYSGNSSNRSKILDNRNNVEIIRIPKPVAGLWQVQVIGANIPQGPQPFAVVSGGVQE